MNGFAKIKLRILLIFVAQSQTNVIPAPYFIYRGETSRVGEGTIVRALAIDKSWYEFDLSLAGSFNANSEDNEARVEMSGPVLSYRQRGWLTEKTALSASLSPTWATEKRHDYFYQVDNDFITDQRQVYDVKGGYLGTNLSIGLSFDATKDIRVFTFARTSSLHSAAANEISPLFKDKSTYAYGVGMVWQLWESEHKVSGR